MKKVTGIGGVFFQARDRQKMLEWYRRHLGIGAESWGGTAFRWREDEAPDRTGYTVWSLFDPGSTHFAPGSESFMVNYRVHDLDALIAELRSAGVEVLGDVESHENGKFAWILDPEGRKVELWEPVDPAADPYLP